MEYNKSEYFAFIGWLWYLDRSVIMKRLGDHYGLEDRDAESLVYQYYRKRY